MHRFITPALALAAPLAASLFALPASAATTPAAPATCSAAAVEGGGYTVNWSRPAEAGASAIWRYVVKVEGQGDPVVRLDVPNRTTENTQRSYAWGHKTGRAPVPTFQIRAVNRAGAGAWCEASAAALTAPPEQEPTPTEPEPTPGTGTAALPYGEDSFFQSEVQGAPVDTSQTTSFHAFMKSHPDQKSWPYPVLRGVGGNMWGSVYAKASASDPVWTIRKHDGYGKTQTSDLMTRGFRAPEWLGQMLTGTSDSPFTVSDPVNGFTVRGDKAVYAGNHQIDILSGGATAVTYHSSNGVDGRSRSADDKRNFMSRGRLSDAMVVRSEVDRAMAEGSDLGHVLHLYFVETSTAAGFTHPMVGTESNKNGWGAEGARIAIAPNVDLSKRGLSPAGLVIARTLQNYGAYIGDNAGSQSAIQAEVEKPGRMVWNGLLNRDSLKGITWDDFVVIRAGWQ